MTFTLFRGWWLALQSKVCTGRAFVKWISLLRKQLINSFTDMQLFHWVFPGINPARSALVPVSTCLGESSIVKQSRGGLVFKADRLVYHSTLGLRAIKKKQSIVKAAPCRRGFKVLRLFFFITLEPRVEWYTSLWALNTSPPRNRFTFLGFRGCVSRFRVQGLRFKFRF